MNPRKSRAGVRAAPARGGHPLRVLALLAIVLPWTTGALAADARATRVDFVAVEDAKAKKVPRACRIGVQVGLARPSMRAVDRYTDWIASTFPARLPAMDEAVDGGVQFDCAIDNDWRVGVAWRGGRADTSGTVAGQRFGIAASFSGGELLVARRLVRSTTGINLDALTAVGLYRSSYRESEGEWRVRGSDRAPGFRIGVEASWPVSSTLELFARVEHLWLRFDDYRDAGGRISFVSPGAPRATVDFSGPALGVGVRWTLR